MSFFRNFFAPFAAFAFIASCSPNPHAEKAKILDSLSQELVQTEQILYSQNHKIAETVLEEVTTISALADSYLANDSTNLISNYQNLQLPLKNYLANYSLLTEELKVAKLQLNSLSNDLKKGLIIEKSDEFFEMELSIAIDLNNKSKFMASEFETALLKFNDLQPKIIKLVEESANRETTKTE